MVYKHPIEILKEDICKIIEKIKDEHKQKHRNKQIENRKSKIDIEQIESIIGNLARDLDCAIDSRCLIAIQQENRKETENTIFIQNSKGKIKDEKNCRDLVTDILKKEAKVTENNIGHINVQMIKSKVTKKATYKVQMEPWNKKKHETTKDGKKIKKSLASTFFETVRAKPELLQKDGITTAERQIPKYCMADKKQLDFAAKMIRDIKKEQYQTKVKFNAKENRIEGKFRVKGTKEWKDIDEDVDDIPDKKVKEFVENREPDDYILDEKETLIELLGISE